MRPEDITAAALDVLLADHPLLTATGYPGLEGDGQERQLPALEHVQAAATWLATVETTTRIDARSPDSFQLTQVMQRETGEYVRSGEFTAAALLMGLRVRIDTAASSPSPNPGIGVSRVGLRQRLKVRSAVCGNPFGHRADCRCRVTPPWVSET